jgi:hypothetical protein
MLIGTRLGVYLDEVSVDLPQLFLALLQGKVNWRLGDKI